MIISRTPLRISFVGGGSDLPAFYCKHLGAVVSTAINKYIYITVNRKFDNTIRVSYSKTEIEDHVKKIRHELVREALRLVGIDGGIEITSISDIPSEGTGLGSSSSYTVGLLNALYAFKGQYVGAEHLARQACEIEITMLKKPIGKQDQYIASYGGLQFIQFNQDGSTYVDPIICRPDTKWILKRNLLLLYTGITRSADTILIEQKYNTEKNSRIRKNMMKMVDLVQVMREALSNNSLDSFGKLLHENWVLKKQMALHVSNQAIDTWYETARKNGAFGGKILGAGGGGFLLLYAPESTHENILRWLPNLTPVSFEFEPQGSKIIFVSE